MATRSEKMANLQHGQLFADKWVQHLRAKSAAAQLHCQYCSVSQGFPSEAELLHHTRRYHGDVAVTTLQAGASTSTASYHPELQRNKALPHEDRWTIRAQPDTNPISNDQVIAEVNGIYAGLVMVEGKCIQVELEQAKRAREMPPEQPLFDYEQCEALIAHHSTPSQVR